MSEPQTELLEEDVHKAIPRSTEKDYATDPSIKLRYDMENAPIGVTMLLLSHPAGILHKGKLSGNPHKDADICAYCLMPVRDKEEEVRRGLFTGKTVVPEALIKKNRWEA